MYDTIDALLTDLGYGPASYQPGGALYDQRAGQSSNFFDNYGGIAAAGLGGLLGFLGSDSGGGGGAQITGYQGGIPRYTATRTFTPPPADRVPGSAGYRYFSDVVYTPQETEEAAPSTSETTETPQTQPDYSNDNQSGFAYGGRVPRYAAGGLGSLGSYSDGGRMLKGPGTGQSDDIPATIENKQPARLARDEFVIPADVVSMLGDGSSDAGAERLYAMMDRIRKAAHGKTKQQSKINPKRVLPA